MPVSQFVFSFFIVFGGRSMSVHREFVLIGRLPVRVGHDFLLWRILHPEESSLQHGNTASCLRVIPLTDRDHQK
jgi:hypothetical protein